MTLEFTEDGIGVGIPYDRCVRVDGINHGYIDLKKSPEKIALIPELDGYPELFRFVQSANAEESIFRTAGCSVSVSAGESNVRYMSFIHIVFEILHWNTNRKSYRILFDEFQTWKAECEHRGTDAAILFSSGPASFWDHGFDGYSLRLYVTGRGQSAGKARDDWRAGLALLSLFFDKISSVYQPQLRNCVKRVS